jgi:hypothetical protein
MSGKVKPKKPTGTRYKKPKYRNISTIRKLPKSNTTNITPAANFQLFTPNFQFPGLKSERVPTPEEEEEENIQVVIEDDFPINNNRGPQAAAAAADFDEDNWSSNNRGPQAAVKHKWYVDDNIIPPRAAAASCYDYNRGPHAASAAASASASAASCYDSNRGPPRAAAAAARFNSDEYEKSIRKELENRGDMPPEEDDMIQRTFSSSDIPNYPVTTRRVEMPSLMQISLDMNDVRTKINKTRAICESNEGTHLPVCVASAFSALGLMLQEDLMDEIEIQRDQPIGRTDKDMLEYLWTKGIITSKLHLEFESEEELIAKLQLLLRTGNATIITVYGGNQLFSHMVLIVNAGPHIDRGGRHRSGIYCVDILENKNFELDAETNAFQKYLSEYGRNTKSILAYNGITITERLGLKRKMFPEEIHIRKKPTTPSKKRRLNGGRKTRKHVHL